MKKILFVIILFFGLIPCIKKSEISLINTSSVYAEGFGDEGDDDGGGTGGGPLDVFDWSYLEFQFWPGQDPSILNELINELIDDGYGYIIDNVYYADVDGYEATFQWDPVDQQWHFFSWDGDPCLTRNPANAIDVTNSLTTPEYQADINNITSMMQANEAANVGILLEIANPNAPPPMIPNPANTLSEITTSFGFNVPLGIGAPASTATYTAAPGISCVPIVIDQTGQVIIFFSIHTHPSSGYGPFSTADIYHLMTNHAINNNYNTIYVFAANGERYALHITDLAKMAQFLISHPPGTTLDPITGDWVAGSVIAQQAQQVFSFNMPIAGNPTPTEANEAFMNAQAFILDSYDSGVTLMKANANGDFKEVHVVQPQIPGLPMFTQFICP